MAQRRRSAGEGSVHQVKGRGWAAAVHVQAAGRRRRVVRYARNHAEALRLRDELLAQARANRPIPPARLTVGDYLTGWLASHVKPGVRPSTFRTYAGIVRLTLAPQLGALKLAELSPLHIRDMMAARLMGGAAPATVNREREVLRNALARAIRAGLLSSNAAALADAARGHRYVPQPYDLDEAQRLLDAVKNDRLYALYLVTVSLGLRQGEVCGLTWDDVDLDGRDGWGELRVVHQLQRDRRAPALVAPKSEESRRKLPLWPELTAALRAHRQAQNEAALRLGRAWLGNPWDLVFTTAKGTPLDGVNLTHRFQELAMESGLRRISFHELRHTAGALMRAAGVDLNTVSKMLGHSDIRVTATFYGSVGASLKRDAGERMAAAFSRTARSAAGV